MKNATAFSILLFGVLTTTAKAAHSFENQRRRLDRQEGEAFQAARETREQTLTRIRAQLNSIEERAAALEQERAQMQRQLERREDDSAFATVCAITAGVLLLINLK